MYECCDALADVTVRFVRKVLSYSSTTPAALATGRQFRRVPQYDGTYDILVILHTLPTKTKENKTYRKTYTVRYKYSHNCCSIHSCIINKTSIQAGLPPIGAGTKRQTIDFCTTKYVISIVYTRTTEGFLIKFGRIH